MFCNRCGAQNSPAAQFCSDCGGPLGAASQLVRATSVRYGGFWVRYVAALINGILVQVVVTPVAFVLGTGIGAAGYAVSMPGEGTRIVAFITDAALGFLAPLGSMKPPWRVPPDKPRWERWH